MKPRLKHAAPVQAGGWSPSNRVVERLQSAIEAVLQRVLGATDPEYEDVLQNSLERVVATLDQNTFRGECPLSVWAALIARKAAADALRERYRARRVFVEGGDDVQAATARCTAEAAPEQRFLARERLRRFNTALSRLRVGGRVPA